MARKEVRVYGWQAVQAVWQHRQRDIVRAYVSRRRVKALGALLKWCATQRLAYHIVDDDELKRITESQHHEGVALLTKERQQPDLAQLLARSAPERQALLWLDGVGNPHNLGSLLRTAAHFAIPAVLGDTKLPRVSAAAARVAQGASELVDTVVVAERGRSFTALRQAGFRFVGASQRRGNDLYATALPERSVFVLGNEVQGLSSAVEADLDVVARIPGSGAVESLNVAVAGGLLCGEFWRQGSKVSPPGAP